MASKASSEAWKKSAQPCTRANGPERPWLTLALRSSVDKKVGLISCGLERGFCGQVLEERTAFGAERGEVNGFIVSGARAPAPPQDARPFVGKRAEAGLGIVPRGFALVEEGAGPP